MTLHEKQDRKWCAKGYEVAHEHLQIQDTKVYQHIAKGKSALEVKKSSNEIIFSGKNFIIKFDAVEGHLKTYNKDGK